MARDIEVAFSEVALEYTMFICRGIFMANIVRFTNVGALQQAQTQKGEQASKPLSC